MAWFGTDDDDDDDGGMALLRSCRSCPLLPSLELNPDQGDDRISSFLSSSDEDEYQLQQPDQGDGFDDDVVSDNDEGSVETTKTKTTTTWATARKWTSKLITSSWRSVTAAIRSCFRSSDGGDEHHQLLPANQGDGFIIASDSDDEGSEQSDQEADGISVADEVEWEPPEQSDEEEDDTSIADEDGFDDHDELDQQYSDQEDDGISTAADEEEDFVERGEQAGRFAADLFIMALQTGAIRSITPDLYAFLAEAATIAAALEAAEAPPDDCCPVCLVQEDDGEGATWCLVAACGHRFHVACVDKWLRVKPTCPVCRCSALGAAVAACDDDAAEPAEQQQLPSVEETMEWGRVFSVLTLLSLSVPR